MNAQEQIAANVRELGVYPLPIANDWVGLAPSLMDLYADRIANLPWVPKEWISKVAAIHGKYSVNHGGNVIVMPATAVTMNTYGTPSFLNTAEKQQAWSQLGNELKGAYDLYARKRYTEGQVLVQKASDKAEFWNKLWEFKEKVENAGSNLIGAVLGIGAAGLFVYLITRNRGN